MNRPMVNLVEMARVGEMIEDWVSAVRRRDVAGVVRNRAADILMFDVPPPLQLRGVDAYAQSWDAFFAWAGDPVRFDVAEMSIMAGADVAFATGVILCGSGVPPLQVRLTMCLRRVEGVWKFVHEHHSVTVADELPDGSVDDRDRVATQPAR